MSRETVRLLGREVPVATGPGGAVLACHSAGKAALAEPVRNSIARTFGDRLDDARGAMERLATSLDPEDLNRVGFRLYEAFRPEVPEGTRGWGARGELHLDHLLRESEAGTG